MKEFTRSCSHILNLICFVLHLLLFSFQRSIPLRSILHSPSGESPCRSVPSLCDSLYIIPHFLSLVKGFSKSFLKFFSKVFRKTSETVSFSHRLASGWYFLHPHFQALDYYTTFCSVCQEVFRKFFEVFSLAFVFDKPLRIRFVRFPSRIRPVAFIKPSFRALDYYTTFLHSCQAFLRQKHSQKHRRFDTEKLPFSQSVILQSQSAPADAKNPQGRSLIFS